MPGRSPQSVRPARSERRAEAQLQRRWEAAYGHLLATQLEPSRRYSIVKIGSAEFAYTRYDQLIQALGQAWALGFVAEARPSVLGSDLPDAAPALVGVDSDLSELDLTELVSPRELP